MGSAFFIGWLIGLFFIPMLADKHGRRKIFVIGLMLAVVNYIGVIFTTNLTVMTCLFAMNGFIMSIRESLGYVYMMEFIPIKYKSAVGTIQICVENTIVLWSALYFQFISD